MMTMFVGISAARAGRHRRGHARVCRPAASARVAGQDRLQTARPHGSHIAHVPGLGCLRNTISL